MGEYSEINKIVRSIREKVIETIRTNLRIHDIEALDHDNGYLDIEMMRHGKMCKVIKLGSKSENNINTEIKTIEKFNELLTDYRYNKCSTDSYYKIDVIVSFRCCVYRYDKKDSTGFVQRISFIPNAKLIEMRYNKANCVSMIDLDDKVMMTDNVLVL